MNGDRDPEEVGGLIQHRFVELPGVRLHLVEAGQGRPVILLHGFPEAWFSWRRQIPALAAAGYRVLAPDMRGYNLSSKPKGVGAYRIERLVSDVAGLVGWARTTGRSDDAATVVGHDWGGIVAWHFAIRRPDLLDRLVILNAPHPGLAPKALSMPVQWLRSSYALFFQLPLLPERLMLARDAAAIRTTLAHDPVRMGAFSPQDIERYVAAARQPGALTAGINYYRAAFRHPNGQARLGPISAPVLVVWGEQDRYLSRELADPPRRLVPHVRVERLSDASHWVQNDRPERINKLLLAFLDGKEDAE